jgi:hypothetical protein
MFCLRRFTVLMEVASRGRGLSGIADGVGRVGGATGTGTRKRAVAVVESAATFAVVLCARGRTPGFRFLRGAVASSVSRPVYGTKYKATRDNNGQLSAVRAD